MDVLISCDDKTISSRLRSGLSKLGIDCPHAGVLSHESAHTFVSNSTANLPSLLFFCVLELAPDDLATLQRLAMAAGNRLKIVVVGLRLTSSAILQAVRSGAIDGINVDDSLEAELRRLLERLQTTLEKGTRLGRLLSVVTPLGGAGSTMIATNLAAAIAREEKKCCLLDLHWRGGDVASFLNSEPRHTLLSLAGKSEQLDRSMFEQSLIRHASGIDLLASPEPYSDYRQIRPELIQKIVQIARTSYATTIADLEDCEHTDQVKTLAASDQIIIPFRPDLISLVRIKKLLAFLSTGNVPREHVVLVASRTGLPKELSLAQINEVLGTSVMHQIPDDAGAANEAINLGIPLVEAHPKSKATASLLRLADAVRGIATKDSSTKTAGAKWFEGVPVPDPLKSFARLLSAVAP